MCILFSAQLLAQNKLTETHTAIFFKPSIDKTQQLAVLKKHGINDLDKVVNFLNRPIIFAPQLLVNQASLKAEESVEYLSPVHTTKTSNFVTYRSSFFVKLKNESDMALLENEAKKLEVEILGANKYLPEIVKLKTDKDGIDAMEAVIALKATELFQLVSPHLMHSISDCGAGDPLFNRQWNLKNEGTSPQGNGTVGADMDMEQAWTISTGSADIKIAILDSGVDTLHPEFAGKLLPGFDAMGDSTKGYPTPNFDSDGHGTACAGIAAAIAHNDMGIAGVCPDCKIIPVRVFQYQNFGADVIPWSDTETFMNGISWAWQEGNADVASNSWGVPDQLLALFPGGEDMVNLSIDAALENGRNGKGMPLLFSSGNDGISDTIPIWPARYEPTIAVGASSMCDEHKSATSCDGESWWAGNWGLGLDVSAPGVRIPTTDMLGGNGFSNGSYYNTFNGTSAACPNAAGVAALILSENPQLSAEAVRRTLRYGAEKVGGYDYSTWTFEGNWSYELGYGRVNAYATLLLGESLGIEKTENNRLTVQTFSDRHIIGTNATKIQDWQLFDMSGRMVRSGRDRKRISIDHNGLRSGIYALRIYAIETQETIKLLVK